MVVITFEGGECVGKDTQVALLAERLRSEGYNVSDIKVSEPGSTPVGDMCRILVKNTIDKEHLKPFQNVADHIKDHDITPLTQMSLFFASRAEVYDKLVKPEKEKGKIIILNRSVDSTTVYQGHAQKKTLIPLIRNINEAILDELHIDMTVLLDIPVDVTLSRMHERDGDHGDRFQDMDESFHTKVREGYLKEAEVYSRIKIIDATTSIEDVHDKVYEAIKPVLSYSSSSLSSR